ncbi:MAG: hypothetical protein QOH52_2622, partial [Pseudonocardiales bacterium]|nr:hypothetical protein [Pseudonocardiales bacterium]
SAVSLPTSASAVAAADCVGVAVGVASTLLFAGDVVGELDGVDAAPDPVAAAADVDRPMVAGPA